MPQPPHTVDLDEYAQKSDTGTQEWLYDVMFGTAEGESEKAAAPAPAPASDPRREQEEAYRRAQQDMRDAELREHIKRLEAQVAENSGKVVDTAAPALTQEQIEELTPEEKKLLFGDNTGAEAAMQRLVQNAIAKQHAKQAAQFREREKAFEERVRKLEAENKSLSENFGRSSAESRANMVSAQITAALPHAGALYSNPNMQTYMEEILNTPTGQMTRAQMFQQAQTSGNSAFIIDGLREFERRYGGNATTTTATNAPTPANATPASRGNPTLAALNRTTQRKPNVENLRRQYEHYAAKIRSGAFTQDDAEKYDAVSRAWQSVNLENNR